MSRKPTKPSVAMKTYLLEKKNGNVTKVTVPASWKVTFGPVISGGGDRYGNSEGRTTLALRFYEAKDRQRAIFTDVKSFRDASIQIAEKVTKTEQQRVRKKTPEGEKDFVVEARYSEWRNPDDDSPPVPNEFRALPKPESDEEDAL